VSFGKKKNLHPARRETASELHRFTLGLAREAFPMFTLLEEQTIEVRQNGKPKTLFVDIVIRELCVCIECQGRQHDEHVPYFHKTQADFNRAKERDALKTEAIYECGMVVVYVYENEKNKLTKAQLERRILQALKAKKAQ
jgi:hypothetical protein